MRRLLGVGGNEWIERVPRCVVDGGDALSVSEFMLVCAWTILLCIRKVTAALRSIGTEISAGDNVETTESSMVTSDEEARGQASHSVASSNYLGEEEQEDSGPVGADVTQAELIPGLPDDVVMSQVWMSIRAVYRLWPEWLLQLREVSRRWMDLVDGTPDWLALEVIRRTDREQIVTVEETVARELAAIEAMIENNIY
ncbi:hypothetical protein R1sor_016351 [Riccia sorocarpa]|uniref:F-box domain-containing protein n=1 Tax=Riccia sorocarpa TaxID=122646 RepID=A0ABD3HHZ8_9MARC